MVEGGVVKPNKTEFSDCWNITWRSPYIMRLAFSAGIGGFLFGYDTGVISGAMLYIKDDFESVAKSTIMQELIVSMTVAGAIFGAAFGGYFNDRFGRKKTIIGADFVFFVGAVVMATAAAPWVIILGRILVGLGVGMASMTAPLYISEASPAKIRGAIVSTNGLMITGGQFISYLINLGLSKAPGTWRWMLGVCAIPPVIQILLMITLPESPRWLYKEGKVEEAAAVLARIYPEEELEYELNAMKESVENEREMEASIGTDMISKLKGAFGDPVVRRGLSAGITVQIVQQFVGINTVMYYAPTIVQFAGFASNSVALALSLITSGLNAIGTIISMLFVDRYGRRRLMIISLFGIIIFLVLLSVVFFQVSSHTPPISALDSAHFGPNTTCPAYLANPNSRKWNCMSCLKAACSFCSNHESKLNPGACLVSNKDIGSKCHAEKREWFEEGCPSKIGFAAIIFMALYIVSYAPGISGEASFKRMGTVPWIVNSEIYPLRYRGLGGGVAAVANWTSNLVMSLSFLSLAEALGTGGAFLLYAGFSLIGLVAIYFVVPETKGLQFEEVEKLLKVGFWPKALSRKGKRDGEGKGVDSA